MSDWGEMEPSLLEEGRGPVPAFPLGVLPTFWRNWIEATARSAGAPVDYVAQSLLAGVAGLAGVGAQVRLTPRWTEPLVLWQAMVGPPSSGKSSAMAPMRDMLSALEARPAADGTAKPRRVVDDAEIGCVADSLDAHPRGVILWRDEQGDLLARLGCADPLRRGDEVLRVSWLQAWSAGPVALERGARRYSRFPVSLMVALRPDRVAGLSQGGEEIAARFLFTWPHGRVHASLVADAALSDEEVLASLRRLVDRLPGRPLSLTFDDAGTGAFDASVKRLNGEQRETDGLEAAWLGKGASAVARLAGVLQLLTTSRQTSGDAPTAIGRELVEHAITLWSDYFRPHALALFHHEVPSDTERRARQVVRWLRQGRQHYVSGEDVRCMALRRAVNARETEQILYRLDNAAIVARDPGGANLRGRPPSRWFVNPGLFGTPSNPGR